MRAVAGMQLAGEVLKYMNDVIASKGASKFGIQFGAYATFMSFFGLADLPAANADFKGIVDYASSMTFELFTTADASAGFPGTQDLQVRFLFHNGTASNTSAPVAYPLFGGKNNAISWSDFQSSLEKFAIKTTEQWCNHCGSTSGSCAAYAGASPAAARNSSSGMSPAVGGVIGAFVTLAVVLGGLLAFVLLGGFRLVRKNGLVRGAGEMSVEPKA